MSKKGQGTDEDRPPIYVTAKGGLYVKADELLRSKRARVVIDQMVRLAESAKEHKLRHSGRESS